MKVKMKIAVSVLLLMGLITGCSGKQGGNDLMKQETESLGFTIPSAILETKDNTGDVALYYIPNEQIEYGFMQNLTSFHGNFLLYGFSNEMTDDGPENTGFHLQMLSPATGEVVAQKSFSDMELPNIQDLGDKLAITDWGNGKVLILDENLQEIDTYQVTCEYNSMYVSLDAKKVYVFMPDLGLQITELSTGKMTVELEDTVNLFVSNECGNVITFSYTDLKTKFDECGAIDLETGKIIEAPFDGSYYDVNYVNDTWMAARSDNLNIHYIGNEDGMKTFEYDDVFTAMEMRWENGNIMSKRYDEDGFLGLTMYNVDGEFVSRCDNHLKGADIQYDLVWSEGDYGYFFLMMDPAEKDKLMFWDMNTEASGTDLSFQKLQEEILPEGTVAQELYTMAKSIGYKHEIEIRIAEQMDEDYNDYKVEAMLDENRISKALDILSEELMIYPEGYFSQLLYGGVREIEIHLAGALTNLSQPEGEVNGFTSYSGFAQTREGKAVIVLDVQEGDAMANYLHHELFHLLDDKLAFDASIREDAMYSEEEWTKLNPEGFEYAESTFVLPDKIYNEEYDVWFIDIYSRTTAREDRARIMEYAMTGDHNMFISAPHRQAKLEYLNKCIRDSFDTFGWPEKTVWEKTLQYSY